MVSGTEAVGGLFALMIWEKKSEASRVWRLAFFKFDLHVYQVLPHESQEPEFQIFEFYQLYGKNGQKFQTLVKT